MERNELCWCGSGKKYKKCHMQIDDKILLLASEGHIVPDRSMHKPPAQIVEITKRQIRKYVLRCRGTHKEEVLLARTIECLRQGSELLRQN